MEEEQLQLSGLKQVQLVAMREILRATSAALPLDEILPIIANMTIIAFDALTAWAMLVEDGQLRTILARGEGSTDLIGATGDLSRSVVGRAARGTQPTILSPHEIDPADPVFGPLSRQRTPVVLLPIQTAGQVHGLLGAVVSLEASEDITFLVMLAEYAAVVIEDARLRAEAYTWRQRLDAVIEQIQDAVLVYNAQGKLVLWNATAEQWLHRHQVQPGDTLMEIVRKIDLRNAAGNLVLWNETAVAHALRGEGVTNQEEQMPGTRNGATRYVLTNAVPLRTNGQIDGAVVVWRDITARKQVEAERERLLAQLEHEWGRLTVVLQHIPIGILIAEAPTGKIVFGNSQAERMLGHAFWSLASIADYTFYRGLHTDGRPYRPDEWPLARTLATGEVVTDEEIRIQRSDGSFGVMRVNAAPIYNEVGQITIGVATLTDITERKQVENALRASEIHYRRLIETASEGIWMIDDTGHTVYVNQRMAEMLGYTEAELIGQSSFDPILPEDLTLAQEKFVQRQQKIAEQFEFRLRRKDGSVIWTQISTSIITDDADTFLGVLGMFTDITERKQAEVERAELLKREQAARAEAQEAVQVRDAFLSIASHEIKNPLTVILGQTALLQRRATANGSLDDRDQRALNTIVGQTRRLNSLITTLLDISRIELGQLAIAAVPLDICALIRHVVAETQPTSQRHTLVCTTPDFPLTVAGDALRLEQVFTNLISNAIKYSPGGGAVTVQVTQQENSVAIAVTDEGIGIPATELPHLFQRFYRVDNIACRHISGSGIGLYVVKELVTLHGGSVAVESSEDVGSTFTVYLPYASQDELPQE